MKAVVSGNENKKKVHPYLTNSEKEKKTFHTIIRYQGIWYILLYSIII